MHCRISTKEKCVNNNVKTLFEGFQGLQQTTTHMDGRIFTVALLASLVSSLVASALYRFFYENRGTGSQAYRAFPLLGISITTLFIAVQISIPLSLGLLGALSIIRFRTPIKEPEEVGFLMLVISSVIVCATLNFQFLVILYIFAFGSLLLVRWIRHRGYLNRDGLLVLTLKDSEALSHLHLIEQYLQKNSKKNVMESVSSKDGITSLQFSFLGLKSDVPTLQEGLRAQVPLQSAHLFFNRAGGVR